MKRSFFQQTSLFLIISLFSKIVFAAPPVVIPPAAAPDRVEQNLQIENERPEVVGQYSIGEPDKTHAKVSNAGPGFTLNAIVLENANAFPGIELENLYKNFIGTRISLATLYEIAARITAHYRNAGYILSRAIVPPQHITNGVVTIRVVEGFVGRIIFEGAPVTSALLFEYADKIRTAKLFDEAILERYLLLINDLPGISAHATLRPSEQAGASDVIITLTEKTLDGSLNADNRGSRYMGPYQGGVTLNANNVLGFYERTQFRGVSTGSPSEETFGQITHEEPLDSEGTKLALSVGHTHTRPGYKLRDFDVKGVDKTFSAQISHPFIRSRQTNLYGNIGFDIRNTDTEALNAQLNGDRLRVARAGGSYDFADRFMATNRFEAQLSKGFGWLDDAPPFIRSRANGRTVFYKTTAQGSRLQPIGGPFGLSLAASGQLSSDALFSAEQFGLGGANFGSAYDPSEITGDSGIAGRAELQFSDSGPLDFIHAYQLYGFYDIGKVWSRNVAVGSKSEESLASVGLGTRFNLLEAISANLEVALPATKPVAANNTLGNGSAARVFFSLIYRY